MCGVIKGDGMDRRTEEKGVESKRGSNNNNSGWVQVRRVNSREESKQCGWLGS